MDVPGLLDDPEETSSPISCAIDAHVHLFPDRVFEAIWRWFDEHAWPIRYRLRSEEVIEHLASRGVSRMLGLHYAHKPGVAESLNAHVLDLARRFREVIPAATVFPGERGARDILRRALGEGARAIKIHCHVMKIAPDDPRLDEVFEEAARANVAIVMHSGREPSSPAYGVDTRALCSADAVDRVLRRHPGARLVVPHLGADEIAEYDALLDRHPSLFLDTTMAIAGYFKFGPDPALLARRADRLLYGSDFPNLPYAWSRELRVLARAGLDPERLRSIASANALRLFSPADFSRAAQLGSSLRYHRGLGDSMPRPQDAHALADTEESYKLLVSSVRDYAIFHLDTTGHVSSWNLGAERINGYSAGEIVGKHFSVFYPPEDVASGKCDMELARASAEGRFEDEGWRVRKDGARFWSNVVITALRGTDGALVGFAKVTRDLTERKRAEEQRLSLLREQTARLEAESQARERARLIGELESANKGLTEALRARDDFLSMASHELKTPLYTIQLQVSSSLRLADGASEKLRKRLSSAEHEIARLSRLINNLLDVSRITAGRWIMSPERTDLAALAREVVDRHKDESVRYGAPVSLAAPPALEGVWDRMKVDQILTNLLSNALKYGDRKPVTVQIASAGERVRIDVIDRGIGIDARDRERIFERFERAVSNDAHAGFGLGLWIVRQIVEAMGGAISLTSELGRGSTFSVELPRHQAERLQGPQ